MSEQSSVLLGTETARMVWSDVGCLLGVQGPAFAARHRKKVQTRLYTLGCCHVCAQEHRYRNGTEDREGTVCPLRVCVHVHACVFGVCAEVKSEFSPPFLGSVTEVITCREACLPTDSKT